MKRKHRLLPIFAILAAFTLSSCSILDLINGGISPFNPSGEVSPTSISLNISKKTLAVNEQYQLVATLSPSDVTNKKINWQSLDTEVATVTNSGLVTAHREGNAIISATSDAIPSLGASCIITVSGTGPSVVYPTSLVITESSEELVVGDHLQLHATVYPSNTSYTGINWSASNNVVSVSSTGYVTANSVGESIVYARSTYDSAIYDTCAISVSEGGSSGDKDAWTIMIYMCGSNLESDYAYEGYSEGLASMDISEILSVSGQPDDVNIIIETGGASKWGSEYGISSSKLERYHVANKKLVKDTSLTYKSMGLQSTFESFLTWGLTSYPAEKVGVILWNHGGAMDGVCFDEKSSSGNDSLLNSEVAAACKNVFDDLDINKLEWIGYDACLMQVQDIAEFNSHYFNYMIGAQETESGYGWDYDTWVDDLYSKKSTEVILKAIVDGFIKENGGTSSTKNDQTLSYLDLSYMEPYYDAFEELAESLSNHSSFSKSSFRTMMKNNVKHYADIPCSYSEYQEYVNYYGYDASWFTYSGGQYILQGYYMYGSFDVVDMLNKIKTNYSSLSSKVDSLLSVLQYLIAYESKGAGAGNSNGLCVICPVSDDDFVSGSSGSYKASETHFTTWRSLVY